MNIFLVRLVASIVFGVFTVGAIDASALALTGVKSRKVHGTAGTFDLTIDTTQAFGASVTVEPRTIGAGHTIVFQFDSTITATGTPNAIDGFGPIGSVSEPQRGQEPQRGHVLPFVNPCAMRGIDAARALRYRA